MKTTLGAMVPPLVGVSFLVGACSERPTEATEELVPSSITAASATNRTGIAGAVLPDSLSVVVRDQNGDPLPGVPVAWESAWGEVSPTSAVTDGHGSARTAWTLGTTTGEQSASAHVAGIDPLFFSAIVEPASPDTIMVVPSELVFEALGDTLVVEFAVEDPYGNEVAADLTWSSTDPFTASVESNGSVLSWGAGLAVISVAVGELETRIPVTVNSQGASTARLLFGLFDSDQTNLYSVRPDGEDLRLLATGVDVVREWSPDGSRVLFTVVDGTRELYWMWYDDAVPQLVPAEPQQGKWSPDGRSILYERLGDTSLRLFYPATKETIVVVADSVNVGTGIGPDWRPDGGQIAWYSHKSGEFQLYVIAPDGSGRLQLTFSAYPSINPVFSPDGSEILYREGYFRVISRDGSNDRGLTTAPSPESSTDVGQWHPDGERVLISVRGGVFAVHVETGVVDTIFPLGSGISGARWSPDASRLAYADGDGVDAGLWVADGDGGNAVRIVAHPNVSRPIRWRP